MIKDRNLVLNFFDWGNLVSYIEGIDGLEDCFKNTFDLGLTKLADIYSALKTNVVTPQEVKNCLDTNVENLIQLIVCRLSGSDIPLIEYISNSMVDTHTCFLLSYLKSKGVECNLYTDCDLELSVQVNSGYIAKTSSQLHSHLLQLYLESLGYDNNSNPLANSMFKQEFGELCSYRANGKDLHCYLSDRNNSIKKFSSDYPYTSILSPQLIRLAILEEASKRNYDITDMDSQIGDWALRLDKSVDIALDVLLCVIHGEDLAGYFSLNLDREVLVKTFRELAKDLTFNDENLPDILRFMQDYYKLPILKG